LKKRLVFYVPPLASLVSDVESQVRREICAERSAYYIGGAMKISCIVNGKRVGRP